jgi:hypothetical protein
MSSKTLPPLAPTKESALRKSRPIKRDWASGNEAKFHSYREAWARIKDARRQKFFLEAITIQESIISDRLLSVLEKTWEVQLRPNTKKLVGQVIERWYSESKKRFSADEASLVELTALHSRIDSWRSLRNDAVHGIVKSTVARLDDHIDAFLHTASQAAEEGEKIARAIDRWVSKNSRRKL